MSEKYWSERRAWLYLAQRFRKARKDEYGIFEAVAFGWVCEGLCEALGALCANGKIERQTILAMERKIHLVKPHGYCWLITTAKGRNQRVAFCEKQSRLLEGK